MTTAKRPSPKLGDGLLLQLSNLAYAQQGCAQGCARITLEYIFFLAVLSLGFFFIEEIEPFQFEIQKVP